MPELTNELLRTATMNELAEYLPATVCIDDCAAIVARVKEGELVEIFFAGQITAVSARLLYIQPLTDPVRSREVLCEAAARLTTWRQSVLDQTDELARGHAAKLTGIRNHAVRLHEGGEICRGGLDRFLARFDLRRYCDRARVSYSICGHYDLENTDAMEATITAREHLGPDLTELGLTALDPRHEVAITVTDLG